MILGTAGQATCAAMSPDIRRVAHGHKALFSRIATRLFFEPVRPDRLQASSDDLAAPALLARCQRSAETVAAYLWML